VLNDFHRIVSIVVGIKGAEAVSQVICVIYTASSLAWTMRSHTRNISLTFIF
jgi:hypothetical protein